MYTRKNTKILYKDLSYIIQGCFFDIRKEYGAGQKEVVYVNLLKECMELKGLKVEKEKSIKVYSSKTGKIVGSYRPDLIVNDKIPIEVKSSSFAIKQDEKQLYHYLRNSNYELGYLVNFSTKQLFLKRIIYTNDRKPFLKKVNENAKLKKQNQARIVLSCFFVFLFVLFSVRGNAQASVGLSISPQKFDLILLPGDSYQSLFKLTNPNDFALPISVRALPFGAEEGTGEMIFERIDPESPSFWFVFETKDLILQARETRRINFQVSAPPDVEPGGYYVFVYFEPRFPSHYFIEKGPKVIPIIGVPFLISTTPILLEPEQGKEFTVLDFSIFEKERIKRLEQISRTVSLGLASIGMVQAAEPEIFISQKTPSSFEARIKNNDIYHIRPFGTLFVYNAFGNKIGQAELKGQTILPGKSRNFEIILTEQVSGFKFEVLNILSLGKYKAELDVRALSPVRGEIFPQGGNPSLTFFSLRVFYYLIILVIIMIALYFARKRIKLAFKIFFKK